MLYSSEDLIVFIFLAYGTCSQNVSFLARKITLLQSSKKYRGFGRELILYKQMGCVIIKIANFTLYIKPFARFIFSYYPNIVTNTENLKKNSAKCKNTMPSKFQFSYTFKYPSPLFNSASEQLSNYIYIL